MTDFAAAEARLAAALERLDAATSGALVRDEPTSDAGAIEALEAEKRALSERVAELEATIERLRTATRAEIDAVLADLDAVLAQDGDGAAEIDAAGDADDAPRAASGE